MSQLQKNQNSSWPKDLIDEVKAAVKGEIDGLGQDVEPKKRLRFALRRIHELSDEGSSGSRLKLFVFIVSALILHGRAGGLTPKEIRDLTELAESILLVQRVKPSASKISFLHGELHLALSKIYFREGDHWRSAWEQQLAYYLSQRSPVGGEGLEKLSVAIRALRLGNSELAISALSRLSPQSLSLRAYIHGRIELIRALRLSAHWDEADRVLAETSAIKDLLSDEVLELQWQRAAIQSSRRQDISPLVELTRPSGTHHRYDYILECFLWTRVVQSRDYLTRYPNAHSMAHRIGSFPKTSTDPVASVVKTLEECYDFDLPKTTRLNSLQRLIEKGRTLPTVDLELLVWAATARLLARFRADSMASLVVHQYQARSLLLSQGKTRDSLNLLSDVFSKDWFRDSFQKAS